MAVFELRFRQLCHLSRLLFPFHFHSAEKHNKHIKISGLCICIYIMLNSLTFTVSKPSSGNAALSVTSLLVSLSLIESSNVSIEANPALLFGPLPNSKSSVCWLFDRRRFGIRFGNCDSLMAGMAGNFGRNGFLVGGGACSFSPVVSVSGSFSGFSSLVSVFSSDGFSKKKCQSKMLLLIYSS